MSALLLVSGFLFSSEFIFTKLYEKECGSDYKATVNFTLISGVLMLLMLLICNGFTVQFSTFSIIMATLFALVNVIANVIAIKAVSIGSVAIFTLFMMLGGTIVPFVFGAVFLNEIVKPVYIIAVALLVVALALPIFDKTEKNEKNKKMFWVFIGLCLILFFLNGANTIIGKVHQININAVSTIDFLTIKYMVRVLCGIVMVLTCPAENKYKNIFTKNSVKSGFGYAFVHVTATILQLYCALTVDACLMYPLVTGGCLIFTPLLAFILFKEKINKFVLTEIVLSVIATVLFAL